MIEITVAVGIEGDCSHGGAILRADAPIEELSYIGEPPVAVSFIKSIRTLHCGKHQNVICCIPCEVRDEESGGVAADAFSFLAEILCEELKDALPFVFVEFIRIAVVPDEDIQISIAIHVEGADSSCEMRLCAEESAIEAGAFGNEVSIPIILEEFILLAILSDDEVLKSVPVCINGSEARDIPSGNSRREHCFRIAEGRGPGDIPSRAVRHACRDDFSLLLCELHCDVKDALFSCIECLVLIHIVIHRPQDAASCRTGCIPLRTVGDSDSVVTALDIHREHSASRCPVPCGKGAS